MAAEDAEQDDKRGGHGQIKLAQQLAQVRLPVLCARRAAPIPAGVAVPRAHALLALRYDTPCQ